MTPDQQDSLVDAITVTAEVMGNELRLSTVMVMVADLAAYDFGKVMLALTRCRREHSGKLSLKLIMDLVDPGGGFVTANEAWALALPAFDENASVVWTGEMARAWSVAKPIWDTGDRIGARMAFLAAYERMVAASSTAGQQPVYTVSDGWDALAREAAIQKAVSAGLLPAPAPALALPPPDAPMLLPHRGEVQDRREDMSMMLRALAQSIKDNGERAREEALAEREQARLRFEARKAEVVAQALAAENQTAER